MNKIISNCNEKNCNFCENLFFQFEIKKNPEIHF